MPKVAHIVKHYCYEPALMKYITVSVEDEIYRLSPVKAAEAGTSVAGLVRSYLVEPVQDQTAKGPLRPPAATARRDAGGCPCPWWGPACR